MLGIPSHYLAISSCDVNIVDKRSSLGHWESHFQQTPTRIHTTPASDKYKLYIPYPKAASVDIAQYKFLELFWNTFLHETAIIMCYIMNTEQTSVPASW